MNKDKEPPSSTSLIQIERRGAVLQIALNRPEKLNALNAALQTELRAALLDLATDSSVAVLILTGKGTGFCAGLDLKDFQTSLSRFQNQHADSSDIVSVFDALAAVPQPVIAAINGAAVTGGLELVLACDILLASEQAFFADTHVPVRVPPGAGLSQRLARSIGLHRALAVSLTAEFFSAQEAHQWGLVHKVYPADELSSAAWAMAEAMANQDHTILRDIKRLIREGTQLPLGEGLQFEKAFHEAWATGHQSDLPKLGGTSVLENNRSRKQGND